MLRLATKLSDSSRCQIERGERCETSERICTNPQYQRIVKLIFMPFQLSGFFRLFTCVFVLELELIQTQMTQKPMLRA